MRVRKYQMRDTDRMMNMWKDALDAGLVYVRGEGPSGASPEMYFSSMSYCGVGVDFGANVHGMYVIMPDPEATDGVAQAGYVVAAGTTDPGVAETLVKDAIMQAGRLGFKELRMYAAPGSGHETPAIYEKAGLAKTGEILNIGIYSVQI